MQDHRKSDIHEGIGELSDHAANAEQIFHDGCLSTETLLEMMKGNSGILTDPKVQEHLRNCEKCAELVSYAKQTQASYERYKQQFLSAIQEKETVTPRSRWLQQAFYPIRAVARPSMAWAAVAIVAVVLALLPFLFGPRQDDPAMVNALKKIAGLPMEDVDSAQKLATQIKVESTRGVRREPKEIRDQKDAAKEKSELKKEQGDDKLAEGWMSVSNELNIADFFNDYQAIATASGSADSLQKLEVANAKVDNGILTVYINRHPQNRPEFESAVRQARTDAGLQKAFIKEPNNIEKQY